MRTILVDVRLGGRFVFTLRYKFCPAFELSRDDIEAAIIQKRPSLKGKPFKFFIN